MVAEGEKILSKKGFLSSLLSGGSQQKYEDAAELFAKAANIYKVGRQWQEAGDLYVRVAELHEKCSSAHEAASAYVDASKAYKNVDQAASVQACQNAIAHYTEMGRFSQVAKMLKEVGETQEKEGEFAEAVETYQQAADYFNGENTTQSANSCLVKVANLVSKDIDPPDFHRAAGIFEDLGRSCCDTPLLRMNAKGHFLNACLCLMASNDAVAARLKSEDFKSLDYTFGSSRECKFAEDLCQAMDDFDKDAFSTAAFEYDHISPLDPWKTSILLAIKRGIEGDSQAAMAGDDVDLT